MTFSEFAKKIRPIVSGDGAVIFIKTLFDAIIDVETIENGNSITIGDSTCKKYFKEGITKKFAAKIKPFLNPRQFSEYLLQFSEGTHQELYNAFKNDIEGLNPYNAPDMIAELFKDIIITAADANDSNLQESEQKIEMPPPTNESDEGENNYSEADNILLKEFNSDYDEIVEKCFSDKYALSFLDRTLPMRINELFDNKWNVKSERFQDIMLKSNILALLGKMKELCLALDPKNESTHMPIKTIRQQIRNLYIKLHPNSYIGVFPYDVFIESWDEGEDY